MDEKNPLKPYVIRDGVVKTPDLGYILAGSVDREEEGSPHAIIFKWKAGVFTQGSVNFDAHTSCLIKSPTDGMVRAGSSGEYTVQSPTEKSKGNIFQDSSPKPKAPRFGDIRSVTTIAGQAYAVGNGGMVYRLDGMKKWTPIDGGLPSEFDVKAIDGFSPTNLYAAGSSGGLWQFDGNAWHREDLPTSVHLNAVKCIGEKTVIVGGKSGVLVSGGNTRWEVVAAGEISSDIWDLEWFNEALYVSTFKNLYVLQNHSLQPVDFGKDSPKSWYQLSRAATVLWSVGEYDIMSFNGLSWTRVV
jgi:hypothetical protein